MDNTFLAQQLTVGEVGKLLQVSQATVWRLSRAGRIPKPRKIGANSTRWSLAEIRESMANAQAISEEDSKRARERTKGKAA